MNQLIVSPLENIYISPLELCNLNCQYCYTNKTKNILTNDQILQFVDTYSDFIHKSYFINLKSILFCGGEVFTLPHFIDLVNHLLDQKIFVSIITNGTIDHLDQINDPLNCQLLVSFDGPAADHDANRGPGTFVKSQNFVAHALKLGFPVEIMYLVTARSFQYIDSFNLFNLKNNYITYKTKFFTAKHPLSQSTPDALALTRDQIIHVKKNYPSIPAKDFGCFQLTLQSNAKIYGCCESPYPIGKMSDNPSVYVANFLNSLKTCQACPLSRRDHFFGTQSCEPSEGASTTKIRSPKITCQGCCAPDFLCGYKKELSLATCQAVVQSFNS